MFLHIKKYTHIIFNKKKEKKKKKLTTNFEWFTWRFHLSLSEAY